MSTKIEWCDESWNPVTGCTPISEGCQHCYAKRIMNRFWPDRSFNEIQFHPHRLEMPLKWKKPRKIFVCSMGDLFHDDIFQKNIDFIDKIIQIVFNSPQHTFMILTKRSKNVLNYFETYYSFFKLIENLWLGVTVENKNHLYRIENLLKTPATVRFVSVEPMLSNIRLADGWLYDYVIDRRSRNFIDWVICGAETGPGARLMKAEWAIDLYEQCKLAGVPFFFKKESKKYPVPNYVKLREYPRE